MEEVLESAKEKLHKKEHAFIIWPSKYQVASIKEEAKALERALTHGTEFLTAPKAPAWVPQWLKRAVPFLGKRKIEKYNTPETVLRERLAKVQANLEKLDKAFIEAVLVPLTLADEGVCNAYYFKTRRHLAKALPESENADEAQAREEAINFGSDHYLNAKRVQLVTLKREGDKLVPAFTEKEAHALDMRVAREILQEHEAAFTLTEDELGKSAAPKTASQATSKG